MTKEIRVQLRDENKVVSRDLQCGIQPGALMQKYYVKWKKINISSGSYSSRNLSVSTFNYSVNVTLDMNRVSFQCDVTIDHDGTAIHKRSYSGGNFKFRVTKGQLYKSPQYIVFMDLWLKIAH